jgi:hypothetical protein
LHSYEAARAFATALGARVVVGVPLGAGAEAGSVPGGDDAGISDGAAGGASSGVQGAPSARLTVRDTAGRAEVDVLPVDAADHVVRLLTHALGPAVLAAQGVAGLVTSGTPLLAGPGATAEQGSHGGAGGTAATGTSGSSSSQQAGAGMPGTPATLGGGTAGTHAAHSHGHGHAAGGGPPYELPPGVALRVHLVGISDLEPGPGGGPVKRYKVAAWEKRVAARLAQTPILAGIAGMGPAGGGAAGSGGGGGGGSGAGAVRGTVHVLATDLPFRLLRDVCTAASCAASADEAWAQLSARAAPDLAKHKRVVREALDVLAGAAGGLLGCCAYSVSDDRFDVVY